MSKRYRVKIRKLNGQEEYIPQIKTGFLCYWNNIVKKGDKIALGYSEDDTHPQPYNTLGEAENAIIGYQTQLSNIAYIQRDEGVRYIYSNGHNF